jgi:hypothetical protein
MALNQLIQALARNKSAPTKADNIKFRQKVGEKLRRGRVTEIMSSVGVG